MVGYVALNIPFLFLKDNDIHHLTDVKLVTVCDV